MRFRTTLWLLLLVAGGFGLLWYTDRHADRQPLGQAGEYLLDVSADEVRAWRILHKDQSLALVQTNQHWRMASHPDIPLADEVVDSWLTRMRRARVREVVPLEAGAPLADYGLVSPWLVMEVQDELITRRLAFGRKTPVGNDRYVRLESQNDVWIVDAGWMEEFPTDSDAFRITRLIEPRPTPPERVELVGARAPLLLEREGEDWFMRRPTRGLVRRERMEQWLQLLHATSIEEFVQDGAYEAAVYGLGEEASVLRLWHEGAELPVVIRQGRVMETQTNLVYAAVEGVPAVVAVTRGVQSSIFGLSTKELLDRKLMQRSMRQVKAIRIKKEEGQVAVSRAKEGWGIDEIGGGAADPARIVALLDSWWEVELVELFDEQESSRHIDTEAPSLATIGFDFMEGPDSPPVTHELHLHSRTNTVDQLVVHYPQRSLWGVVSLRLANTLSTNVLDYRWKEILALPTDEVLRISQIKPGATNTVSRGAANAPWVPEGPGQVVETEAVERVLKSLESLVVSGFEAHQPDQLTRYGLAEPRQRLSIGLSGRSGIGKTLLFGDIHADGYCYAMMLGEETVFRLPASAHLTLSLPLVRRPSNDSPPAPVPPADDG